MDFVHDQLATGRKILCSRSWTFQLLLFSCRSDPTDNRFIEAFNSKSRSECMNTLAGFLMTQVRTLEDRRRNYNEVQRHRPIGTSADIAIEWLIGAPLT